MRDHVKGRPAGRPYAIKAAQALLVSAFREEDLSPRPPLLRGEGESNEALRKHEKGRQECLPHLQTRILNGSTSHYAEVELIDWRISQLAVTIQELIRLGRCGSLYLYPVGVSSLKWAIRARA